MWVSSCIAMQFVIIKALRSVPAQFSYISDPIQANQSHPIQSNAYAYACALGWMDGIDWLGLDSIWIGFI